MYTWKPITRTSLGGRNARSTLRSCAYAEPAGRSAPSDKTSTSAYRAAHRAPRAERAIFFIANPIGVGENYSVTTLTGTCALSACARMPGLDAGVSRAVGSGGLELARPLSLDFRRGGNGVAHERSAGGRSARSAPLGLHPLAGAVVSLPAQGRIGRRRERGADTGDALARRARGRGGADLAIGVELHAAAQRRVAERVVARPLRRPALDPTARGAHRADAGLRAVAQIAVVAEH